jgi:hypothetical protein
MLALIIAAMGKCAFGRVEVAVAWFDLFPVSMTVNTE